MHGEEETEEDEEMDERCQREVRAELALLAKMIGIARVWQSVGMLKRLRHEMKSSRLPGCRDDADSPDLRALHGVHDIHQLLDRQSFVRAHDDGDVGVALF